MENLTYGENKHLENINISSIEGLKDLNNMYQNFNSIDKELLKNEVNEMLKKGYNIYSENQYNQLKLLLDSMDIVILCRFDTLGNFIDFDEYIDLQHKFSIKLTDGLFRLFPGTNLGFIDPVQGGYISDGEFHKELNFSYSDNITDNNQFNLDLDKKCDNNYVLLKSQNEELKKINNQLSQKRDILTQENQKLIAEVKKLKNNVEGGDLGNNQIYTNQNTSQESPEKVSHIQEYTVQSLDTLWKIVETHYGLTSNRDIANCVNKLVKYNIENNTDNRNIAEDNTPDGIFGDKIYAGQKILLAGELKFRDQVFRLKKEK